MNLAVKPECGEDTLVERHNKILSLLSHDLKSPMMAIMGLSRDLLEEIQREAPNAEWIKMLQVMIKAGENVLKLTEDILSMAKLEARMERLEPTWINNLSEEFLDVINTFQYEANTKKINLSVEIKTSLPIVHWDMLRIRYHVINNIVSNALRFTPTGGSVKLLADAKHQKVILRVEDTGPGIESTEVERIFQRFEQIDLKSSRITQGAGMGLSNARLFVELHGGKIYVDNMFNPGTAFVIEIPVTAVQREGEFGFDNTFSENKKTLRSTLNYA